MPLYKTISVNSQTTVKIWKIEESYKDLLSPLNLREESSRRVNKMKSELHQRGFLSVRHLLAEFGYTDHDLYYDNNGKPHLKDGKHISITHSFTFSGVIISDKKIGIDIEKQRDKITRIANKFIDYEFNYLSNDDKSYVNKLTVIWCVKESLYKLYATPGLSFLQNILVIPFMIKDGETVSWIDYENKKERFTIHFIEFEGFTCAYALA
ncbi:4'-phosphopantetheinyl transferase superfamily protein [uncultured Lacinutrix sp.]|uniref:4'-phosphopantetheinyl transferase family protein n=1 Tax=uncultured Lacinutrix sp. TaxID=574032 RepID=UPI002605B7AD|nr:4'-phosphopantetheinyl transferase family protein [uncultured Lacinutrix sp.]